MAAPSGHDFVALTLALDKATTTQTANPAAAADILRDLMGAVVTAQILQSTGLGKLINRLRKSADGEVKDLATKVLIRFKDAVIPTTPSKAKSMPSTPTAASQSLSQSQSQSPLPAVAEAANSVHQQLASASTAATATATGDAAAASPSAAASASSSAVEIGKAPSTASSAGAADSTKMPPPKAYSQSYIDRSKLVPPPSKSSAALSISVSSSSSSPAAPASPVATLATPTSSSATAAASPSSAGGSSGSSGSASVSVAPALQRYATGAPVQAGHGDFKLGQLKDAKRNKMQSVLLSALGTPAPELNATVSGAELAMRLESALFMRYKVAAEYAEQARSIVYNLRDEKNPDLRSNLWSCALEPEEVVTMKPEELASAELKRLREENKKWMKDASRSDWRDKMQRASTDMWRCGKCGQRKCSYYQMQTRSADEPMTTFVRCLVCGNRWRC